METDDTIEYRTSIERDYDRILFSTPIRRLADKTQVFPLEKNDSVRTRLTHSYEVSNLARSVGVALANHTAVFKGVDDAGRNVPAMLAAIGLAHDVGNPPFGHSGERAISSWFADRLNTVQRGKPRWQREKLTKREISDLQNFEGNAQTLRVLTKLQLINDGRGLNLTLGTLGALLKYPVPSTKRKTKQSISYKKFNYFESEDEIIRAIRKSTGLVEGVRHPLTFIMEACDDIAYSVLDVEDSIKKGLFSVSDAIEWLSATTGDETIDKVVKLTRADMAEYRNLSLSPSEYNDACMQKLRVHAIGAMVARVIPRFEQVVTKMLQAKYDKELIGDCRAGPISEAFKSLAKKHAFNHRSVLEIELVGHQTIRSLMDMLFRGIERAHDRDSQTPLEKYLFGRISENYRRAAEKNIKAPYVKYQLLADMVAGMTDGFAMDLHDQLKKFCENER